MRVWILMLAVVFLMSSCQHAGAFMQGFNDGYSSGSLNSRRASPQTCYSNSYNPGYGYSTTTTSNCY